MKIVKSRITNRHRFRQSIIAMACSVAIMPSMAALASEHSSLIAPTQQINPKEQTVTSSQARFNKEARKPKGSSRLAHHVPTLESKSKTVTGLPGMVGAIGVGGPEAEVDPCNGYSQFDGLTGQALYDFVRQAEFSCISELYSKNDATSIAAYQAQNVIDVANLAKANAATYDSTSGSEMLNLFYFLRGAFYIEYYNDGLTYNDTLPADALRDLLIEYSKNPAMSDTGAMQGNTLQEFFISWDSADSFYEAVPAITAYLNGFSESHLAESQHRSALTKALTTLYNGNWDATYTKASMEYDALRAALLKVATSDYIINSAYNWESTDAFHEFGRFYEYQEYWALPASLKTDLNSGVQTYMNKFERLSKEWADAAGYLDYYNPGQCEAFGICGWADELENTVLSIQYSCSDTINIRAQEMSNAELQQSCDLMGGEEILFHDILATGNQPVADDLNTNLEVNIFNSYDDYDQYAGTIFGISTDNGGMYLEGTPSQVGNQARFIAHEATWTDEVLVWNLRHEYVHYLDGRFNQYGAFNYFDIDTGKSVWWSEGLAEYISHQNRYDEAVTIGRSQAFTLSEILSNTYNSGTDRVYRWGYLAVRFLFENHRADVDALLVHARGGEASEWLNYINDTIGTQYDSEWNAWLLTVSSNDTPLDGGVVVPPLDSDGDGVADSDDAFPFDPTETLDSDSDGVGDNRDAFPLDSSETIDSDGDGYGDNSDVFPLDATEWADENGNGIGDNADANNGGGTEPVEHCGATTLNDGNLNQEQVECVSGAGTNYFYTYVAADNTQLYISTAGGNGDVDLYFSQDTWAGANSFTAKSVTSGNNELIDVVANRGWVYISTSTAQAFDGVSLKVSLTAPATGGGNNGGTTPTIVSDACATLSPYSYGGLAFGEAICIADGHSSYYFYVPSDTASISIDSAHGTGDVNLYANGSTWASPTSFDAKSENSGNVESITVTSPNEGWYYISADGAPSSSGASLVVNVTPQ
ncbi:collagenase [Shewanella colwelliana]|uniref:M9 family metallopeptidase n=1 Tax=Shewanella colwelliana TaxID=23 RepID=UPI00299CE4C0|nr:collagenase [Shewanella colwelliana]MDX1280407.1 collagenase [Shewanella colwelliana]